MNYRRLGFTLLGLSLLASSVGTVTAADSAKGGAYTSKDKEYYLSTEQLAFVRPGLEITIDDVTIPEDRKPEVMFTLTDPRGLGLDRDGVTTPGPVSVSFILAYLPADETSYVAYTTRNATGPVSGTVVQASTDSGGTYTDMGNGSYLYKFGTELPADYDVDATHTLGVYGRRDLTEFELNLYVDNVVEHFVPSGSAMPDPRSIVTTETCNGRCHQPLAIHGGQRTDIEVCVLCHNATQSIDPDTGNSVDMPLMTHKIHMGENLANGYTIIGYRGTVHDYSDVVYPGIISDCEACHTGGTPTEDFPLVASPAQVETCNRQGQGSTTFTWAADAPVQIRRGAPDGGLVAGGTASGSVTTGNWITDGMDFFLVDKASGEELQKLTMNTTVLGCANNPPGAPVGIAATDHTAWLVNPRIDSCGSCHDDVNFVTGENHSPFNIIAPDESECALCHRPDSGREFDRSVRGAHTVEYRSVQLDGILIDIVGVSDSGPGEFPTVSFFASDKFGPINPNDLQRLRFSISGPNEDFDYYLQEEAVGAALRNGNRWTYTFQSPIPDDAVGSFSIGVEGRKPAVLNEGTAKEFETEDQMQNYILPFAVTDDEAVPRRVAVEDAKCEACHNNLSLHGGNRNDAQYCTTCHMPQATDEEVRSEDNLPAQSIGFKFMVHKIHRGAELENGYVVLGYRGSVNDFSHVEYTGNLANCEGCHVNDSQQLPLPAGLLPSETAYDFLAEMQPATAACLSCHDDLSSAAHADANTTMVGESCATCHGVGKEFAVDRVHAQ